MKKSKYPVKPEQFERRNNEIIERASDKNLRVMLDIPALAVSQYTLCIQSYYGGRWAAVRALFMEALRRTSHDIWFGWLIWFSDFVGWTKLVDVPETKTHIAHQMRHGKHCHDSPNCSQDCISLAQPKWFRWLMGKEE